MINGDVDYDNEPILNEMIHIMTENMDTTIAFLKNECTEEQLVWLSEIADEITESTRNREFIEALRELCKKYPAVSEKYNIQYFFESAAEYLESVH